MRQGSEKLGAMENEKHENMRQLTILQSFGLSYITWKIRVRVLYVRVLYKVYIYCSRLSFCSVCLLFSLNAAASFCSEPAAEQST